MADLRLNPARASLGFRSGPAAALAALLLAAAPAAAQSGVLPDTGASALVGRCDLTVDGTPYRGCDCRMMISAAGGGYALSGLNVGCQGQAGLAAGLSGLMGQPGRTLQVLYEHGPTTAMGAGTWISTSTAVIENVIADENWLLMTLRLAGPTQIENSRGRACVDGSTGARC